MEAKFERANELLMQDAFLSELKKAENNTDVQTLFANNGVELSLEDIEKMCQESYEQWGNKELDENDLDTVSGGIVISATTAACFFLASASLGFYTSYGYHTFKNAWRKK